MIIGVINQKGGVGKTTLSINIADAYSRVFGKRTLLVDADPQSSSLSWAQSREEEPAFSVIAMATDKLWRDLPKVASDYDIVVIDGPPRVNSLGRAAILASDFVLMPVLPSALDLRATVQTVDLIEEVSGMMKEEGKFHAAFVLNQKRPNTLVAKDAGFALSQFQYPQIEKAITQRVLFAETIARGTTVIEADVDGAASKEVVDLIEEIERIAGTAT